MLSHLLAPQPDQPCECLGTWLIEAFLNEDCSKSLIGSIRDQPSYLNSHYTQHVKKFGLDCSFKIYARCMKNHTKARGERDLWRLSNLILKDPRITAHLFPYGGSKATFPFHQLVSHIGFPSDAPWLAMARVNEKPGRLAMATALAVQLRRARQGCPLTGQRERKRALRLMKSTAKCHGWPKESYSGMTPALYRGIRGHYLSGNDAFPQQVWGEADWSTLFPDAPPAEQTELLWNQRWLVGWESRRILWALQR